MASRKGKLECVCERDINSSSSVNLFPCSWIGRLRAKITVAHWYFKTLNLPQCILTRRKMCWKCTAPWASKWCYCHCFLCRRYMQVVASFSNWQSKPACILLCKIAFLGVFVLFYHILISLLLKQMLKQHWHVACGDRQRYQRNQFNQSIPAEELRCSVL